MTDYCVFSSQLYLSTRRGAWILNRVGSNGLPMDLSYNRGFSVLQKILPYNVVCSLGESMLNQRFDHRLYNLKPKHRYSICIVFILKCLSVGWHFVYLVH